MQTTRGVCDASDGDDALDLGHPLTQRRLDAKDKRRGRHGAAATGAEHVEVHEALFVEVNELDIAAIRMECGTDVVQDFFNASQNRCRHDVPLDENVGVVTG